MDDIRFPVEAYHYTGEKIFLNKDWYIVRNYRQFVNQIIQNGLPEMISFDHDLADMNSSDSDNLKFTEKTGYDCAKWLVEYCMDNHLNLPKFYSHSMNPVGKENILSLLENFKKVNKDSYNKFR
ncbi:cyclic-phosphate processing receiver domain-containing protein [Chryseobacterium sp. T16E-39]|uniref:cyclic-phosphate processing receiver domain-containing protein n=1 Tax=Chryseobacterium sp. T16E-39 TaxID=2015076 RepID=UPI001E655089|nr:cyclic-phosphate processing receiver domain-containing protein [Chryseobacterium sp. T16E-39]